MTSIPAIPAIIQGKPLETLPTDLYIPPEALRIFLESFEGPLDLLLYLIQRQNFDILNVPIAEITRQYLEYVNLIKDLQLDLAADYLVMAALLTEIKSQMLLPQPQETGEEENSDPRVRLIRQLQEYALFKQAAQQLWELPQVGRDTFPVSIDLPKLPKDIIVPPVTWNILLKTMQEVMQRAILFTSHQVLKEPLSVRERMSFILDQLKTQHSLQFTHLFTLEEGRAGAVVTLLAILELARESLIHIIQVTPFSPLQITHIT